MSTTEIIKEKINKKISRRSFLKWSAAIGATSSISGLVLNSASKMAGATASDSQAPATAKAADGGQIVDWKPTCCLICHSWCAQAVGVDSYGHVRKIEGQGGQPKTYSNSNPVTHEQPSVGHGAGLGIIATKPDDANHIAVGDGYLAYAPHNKGRICAKGNDGMETIYDPDRIKYPLKRVGDRGSGQWEKISWDDALNEIADALREIGDRSGSDLRHRVVWWAGRNESGGYLNRWVKAYGTPNRIEHTSICELNRHVAAVSMWNHHWSSVDFQTHTDSNLIGVPAETTGNHAGGKYTLHDDNDVDLYIEVGGNPAECKIPHSTWANHLGDRRRKNLQGYSHLSDDAAGYDLNARKGRIIVIDVRQTNTAAFADEYFMINPTTDGALFLGMFWYAVNCFPGGSAALKAQLDAGHMNTSPATDAGRRYYGLFTAEETAGSSPVPAGKSLESVVNGTNPQAAPYDIAWASTETGISEADIVYLARAVLGLNVNGTYNSGDAVDFWDDAAPTRRFANPVIDGYRGPSQLSNGVYTYKAIRSMQIIAANQSACHYWGGRTVPVAARGGYNAPGAFMSDGQWTPYASGGGVPGLGGDPGTSNSTFNTNLPSGQMAARPVAYQRIDDWDYDRDLPRWRGAYDRWVDQNTVAAMRHSVGLNPYSSGAISGVSLPSDLAAYRATASVKGPYYYKNWLNTTSGTFDPDFRVEVLINHKNAPSYARPHQDIDIELFTAKWSDGEYRIKNIFSIDVCMGDGTRFADIILPDTSTYERYVERSGEGQEMNFRPNLFNRVPVIEWNNETINSVIVPRYLYDSRPVRGIHYELARLIDGSGVSVGGTAPWSGKLYDSFKWVAGDTGNLSTCPAQINDGAYANKEWFKQKAAALDAHAASHGAGAGNGFDFVLNQGMLFNSDDTPAYWRQTYNSGKTATDADGVYNPNGGFKPNGNGEANKLTVYNSVLASIPDIVENNSDDGVGTYVNTYHTDPATQCFWGSPVYLKSTQKNTAEFGLSLTTYKVNVHTQSRTAQSPRLMEITGNNWAVISPATAAANGIANGDMVKVTTAQGSIELEAKVTPKAQDDCVHVSHHMGHRASTTSVPQGAFDSYQVSEDNGVTFLPNREQSTHLRMHSGSPSECIIDDYALDLPATAPGRGVHPNIVINLHSGADDFTDELATDPIGAGIAWGGTKCKIELVP